MPSAEDGVEKASFKEAFSTPFRCLSGMFQVLIPALSS
jgi:hypothetical protein